MCVICVKDKMVKLPDDTTIKAMWNRNPDGAGYMYSHGGQLFIRKGYTNVDKFIEDIRKEVMLEDAAVLHFRISTQANNVTMTHPFPLTTEMKDLKELKFDGTYKIGVAHNGIIRLTTDHRENEFSDTALFVSKYMTRIVRRASDLDDVYVKNIIEELIGTTNKLAILDQDGIITLIGSFTEKDGLKYSNMYHNFMPTKWSYGYGTYGGYGRYEDDDDWQYIGVTQPNGTVKRIPMRVSTVKELTGKHNKKKQKKQAKVIKKNFSLVSHS